MKRPRRTKPPGEMPAIPLASEAQVQRAIIQRLQLSGIWAVHVPNGGARSEWSHMEAKRNGEVAGFPDLLLYKFGGKHGLLEVKKPGWKAPRPGASATRKAWEHRLRLYEELTDRGFDVAVVTSVDEAIAAIREWGWLS